MFRKSASILMLIIIILNLGLCFGQESGQKPMVSGEELIIGEPTTDVLYASKSAFINVNISAKSKVNVADHPVTVSLLKIEDKLPFADALGKDLNVPIIKLSSSALINESPQALYIQCKNPLDAEQMSDGDFTAETKIINKYFETVSKINTLTAEITTANKKYKLDALKAEEVSKISTDTQKAYEKWNKDKAELSELRKNFEQIQASYLRLFEVETFQDRITKLSYLKEVGKLEVGRYKLRFTDENGVFIKEMVFEVVNESDTLKTITPAIGVNENPVE